MRNLANGNSQLTILDVDVFENGQLEEVISRMRQQVDCIDIIINNAAVLDKNESLRCLQKDALMKNFEINSVAPMEVVKFVFDLLKKSINPRILNIYSGSGIISRVRSYNGIYGYKASKAALNMMTRVLAFELLEDNIPVIAIDPGWNWQNRLWQPTERCLPAAGKFLKYDSSECEW